MSRKMLAVAAFALIAPVALAQAQLKFGVGLGASLPGGDIKDGLDMGYHAMATAGIQPPLSPVGFRVDGAFNQFKEKSPGTDNFRIMSLTANAILGMPGAIVIKPYAIGGVGMYNSKSSGASSESSSDMGVNVGAGVSFGLAGFSAFGEIRWHKLFPEEVLGVKPNVSYIPITFGITF